MEPKLFHGTLGADGRDVDVKFTAGWDQAGALQIGFERFPLDVSSAFVLEHRHVKGTKFPKFMCLAHPLTGRVSSATIFFGGGAGGADGVAGSPERDCRRTWRYRDDGHGPHAYSLDEGL